MSRRRQPFRKPRPVGPAWWAPTTEEIYVYRTRKPWAPFGLRWLSRHFGYGGRTVDPQRRDREHIVGGPGRFGNKPPQPWSDLEPKRYVVFKLKTRTRLTTHLLEVLVIRVLFCVYNDKLNKLNPRKISLRRARVQRVLRDKFGRSAMAGELFGRYLILSALVALAIYLWSVFS
jgi:hypothetical protein